MRINAETGAVVWNRGLINPRINYTVRVVDVAFNRNTSLLAALGEGGDARIHRVSDGEPQGSILEGENTSERIRFLGDDRVILHETNGVSIWDWGGGMKLAEEPIPACVPVGDDKLMYLESSLDAFRLLRVDSQVLRERTLSAGERQSGFAVDAARRRAVVAVVSRAFWNTPPVSPTALTPNRSRARRADRPTASATAA